MRRPRQSSPFFAAPLGVTLSYVALLLFWLFLSDPLLDSLIANEGQMSTLHAIITIKDAVFIIFTAPLLYLLIQRGRRATREALEDLREEKAFIESALMALPDIFYAFDKEGKMLRWNNRTEKITGYTSEEIARMSPLEFVADKERVAKAIETIFEEHRPVTVEARYLTQSGEEIPYEFTGAELKDSEGRVIGLAGTGRDITYKKELEEEKEEITRQERAWFAQELHDGVCQQLTSFSIMATTLERRLQEDTPESREEALEYAGKMISLTDRTVKEVRALSHGAAPVDFTREGLSEMMKQLTTETGEAHQVDCSFEAEEGAEVTDPEVATNLYRITQEALSNSIRHGQASHIRVRLGRSGGELLLSVEDDGRGIRGEAKGSGIGLENMHRRAHMIGGALEVKPGPSGGTTVTCVVPENGRGA